MKPILISWWWIMRRSAVGLVALLAGIFAFEFVQPVAVASFGDLDQIQRIFEFVPPTFLALLNVTPEFLGRAGLAGYLSLGFSHPVYHLLAAAAVIWFAAVNLAGEMERGSIQIALSRPVSRLQVYCSRVLGLITVTLLIAVIGPLGSMAGVAVAEPDGVLVRSHFIAQGVATSMLVIAIAGVALLLSSYADRMAQAVGWAIGLLVISYVIDYFADLWSALEPIEPLSIFNYYDPPQALSAGEVPTLNLVVLGTVAVIGFVAGLVVFRRRDLPN